MPDVHNALSPAPRVERTTQSVGWPPAAEGVADAGLRTPFAAFFQEDAIRGRQPDEDMAEGDMAEQGLSPAPADGDDEAATGEVPQFPVRPQAQADSLRTDGLSGGPAAPGPASIASPMGQAVGGAPAAAPAPPMVATTIPAQAAPEGRQTSLAPAESPPERQATAATVQPALLRSADEPANQAAAVRTDAAARPGSRAGTAVVQPATVPAAGETASAPAAIRIDAAPNAPRRQGRAEAGKPDRVATDAGMRVGVRLSGRVAAVSGQESIAVMRLASGAQTAEPTAGKPAFFSERELSEMSFPAPGQTAGAAVRLSAAAQAPAEVARHIATQLADAIPQAAGGDMELALNPRELGRVRISLSHQDAGLAMAITADRSETLELMRRHIDQLAREFRDLGYGDVTFSFGQSGQGRPDSGTGPNPETAIAAAPADEQAMPRASTPPGGGTGGAGGLDLRV